jgi:hypothetical protein
VIVRIDVPAGVPVTECVCDALWPPPHEDSKNPARITDNANVRLGLSLLEIILPSMKNMPNITVSAKELLSRPGFS